jgi:hypothetical protein
VKSFVRMHLPPNLSVWQRSCMNIDTGSVILFDSVHVSFV